MQGVPTRLLRSLAPLDGATTTPCELAGLIQLEIEVERNWFTRVLLGAAVPSICDLRSAEGHDGGFDLSTAVTLETADDAWQSRNRRAWANCVAPSAGGHQPVDGR